MIGHGVRERQIRGPAAPGERPRLSVILVRRFLCLVCDAVMTVVPKGVVAGRLFSGPTMLLGLFLWSQGGKTQHAVRESLNPWLGLRSRSWRALNRWTRAAWSGQLWGSLSGARPDEESVRELGRKVVEQLWARGRGSSKEPMTPDSLWRLASAL